MPQHFLKLNLNLQHFLNLNLCLSMPQHYFYQPKPVHLAAGVQDFCGWSRKLLFIEGNVHSYVEVRPKDVPLVRPKDAPDERSDERCFAAYYRRATQGMLTYADTCYERYADIC